MLVAALLIVGLPVLPPGVSSTLAIMARADATMPVSAPWDAGKTYDVGSPPGTYQNHNYFGHCCRQTPDKDYYAVDINMPGGADDCGQTIRAANSGTLTTGVYVGQGINGTNIPWLRINHAEIAPRYVTEYQHMEQPTGATHVNRGDPIGVMGKQGASACHLHFKLMLNGTSINPGPMSGTPLPTNTTGVAVTSDNVQASPNWGGVGMNATYKGATVQPGQVLHQNEYIESPDGRFVAILQPDGNFVLYNQNWIWQSGARGDTLEMQTDGNLVLKSDGKPVWWSGGNGAGASLRMQSDGNLVTANANGPTWWTGTGGHSATTYVATRLTAGQKLLRGQFLRSPDSRYALHMQTDGSVVLIGPGYHLLWFKNSPPGTWLDMQTDGNLVLRNATTAYWWSGTSAGTVVATPQSDGNFVTTTAPPQSVATWWTGTNGLI